MSGATWCVLICQEFYDGVPSYCAGEGLLAVTTRPPCRMMILKRGDFIASSALRPRRAHSLRNFARRRRSSCLITSVNAQSSSRNLIRALPVVFNNVAAGSYGLETSRSYDRDAGAD